MILSRDEYLSKVQALVGTDTSDDAIKVIEDFTDTYNDMNKQGEVNWEAKYKENDESWRQKYISRFSTTAEEVKKEQKADVVDDGKVVTFDDLFKEREG